MDKAVIVIPQVIDKLARIYVYFMRQVLRVYDPVMHDFIALLRSRGQSDQSQTSKYWQQHPIFVILLTFPLRNTLKI